MKKFNGTLLDHDLFKEFGRINWWINKMAHGEYKHPKAYLFNQAFEQYQKSLSALNEAKRLLKLVEMFPKEGEND